MTFEELYGKAIFIRPSDKTADSPYIRTTFDASDVHDAKITICGLGFFELYINGKKVGNDEFVPANSLYRWRANKQISYPFHDTLSQYRTYSVEYDVKPYLKDGKNALVVHLGNGWYGKTGNHDERMDYFDDHVKLVYKLELTDKNGTRTLVSDENHKWARSFILDNQLYLGEKQDMNLYDEHLFDADYDDSTWESVAADEAHEGEYDIQNFPADRVTGVYIPKLVKKFKDYSVYDCGINMTGYVVVKCDKKGETVRIEHAEELKDDKTLDTVTCAGNRKPAVDTYIADGTHLLRPHFIWHGFRYFTLTNNASPVEAHLIHAGMNITSTFKSDSEPLNWLYETYMRTQLENMHCGVPSDCPTRERLGYTGDGQLCADAAMLMMDGREFYKKWMQDIVDSQCKVSGHVQHTVPFQGGGGGIGGWGTAIIHVPYVYWRIYGDDCLIKRFFPQMLAFMRYMDSRSSAGFIVSEEAGCWNLGDWGFSKQDEYVIPQNYVNTYFYIRSLTEMIEMAPVVGQGTLIPSYKEKAEISKRAMHAAYFSAQTGDFFGDYQGANCFAVKLGIGDKRTYANMLDKYTNCPDYDTGIFATDLITEIFFRNGNAQTAYNMLIGDGDLSFGNMRKGGATTIWEYMWGPIAARMSHNHPMFGACTRQLFEGMLGIRQKDGTCGYTDIVIDPALVRGCNEFEGSIDVGHGVIGVSVKITKTGTIYRFTIPEGVHAVFAFENSKHELVPGVNEFDMQLVQ